VLLSVFMIAALLTAITPFAQTSTANSAITTSNLENTNGTAITLGGKTIHTIGKLPALLNNLMMYFGYVYMLGSIDIMTQTNHFSLFIECP